jgi:6-phosphogluconolactonase (cycloisomerase 2 family)
MRMKVGGVLGGALLISLAFLVACTSNNSTTPPSVSGAVLFVATQGDSLVSALNVDVSTGVITTIDKSSVATGSTPSALVFTPAGDAAFISNSGSNDVSSYAVNVNSGLTAAAASTAAGTSPHGMAIDAAGHFLFVANQGTSGDIDSGSVSVFSIGSGAALTAGGNFKVNTDAEDTLPDAVNPGPFSVAITPDGKFLYTANQFANTVTGFSVDSTSGALTRVGAAVSVGTSPSGMAISPNGNFLYVTNSGSNNVSVFSICDNATPNCVTPDGSLAEITGSPFSAGLGPVQIAISFTGNYAYVVDQNSNQLSGYKLSPGSGTMTGTTPLATVSTGLHPSWVAVSSGEQFVYVANTGSNTVSAFTMDDTTGALTVQGTPLTVGAQPAAVAF